MGGPALLAWPLAIIAAVAALGLARIWLRPSLQRQSQVVGTLILGGTAVVLAALWIVVWLIALSGLRWPHRLLALGAGVVLAGLADASLRIRGLSGDALPLLGWRFAAELPSPVATAPPAATALASSADYPQFLGPRRNATLSGVGLARAWPVAPTALWRQPIGAGWSSFAVAGGLAVTQEQRGDEELVTCYELATGRLRWAHADRARWDDPFGGPGPRATPAIADGRVYALGATGLLNALDLSTGERLWSKDILQDNAARPPTYGVSASPLVVDDHVVVLAGGAGGRSLVGYRRADGARAWGGGDDPAAYSSPLLAELGGVRQIVVFNDAAVAAHDPADGRLLWRHPWPSETENASQPVIVGGDRVFVSSGYGVGGKLLAVRPGPDGRLSVGLLWESIALKAKFTDVVVRAGYLYGLDDGILASVALDDGQRRWKGGRYGHGQLLLVDDLLLVLAENGRVALVEATPEAWRELASFPALEGKTWNHPALAAPYLLVRNDSQAACYALPLRRLVTSGRRRVDWAAGFEPPPEDRQR